MRKRTSIIWTTSRDIFKSLIEQSNTIREVLRNFGLENKGNNYRTFLKRVKEENINIDHIYAYHKKRAYVPKKSNSEVFSLNSTYPRDRLKCRLVKDNLIPYKCKCGNTGEWQGQRLSLQLDHINGIPDDNRLENLRFICPNCHSQTETFAGKKTNRIEYKDTALHGIKPERKKREYIKKLRPSKLRDKLDKQKLEDLINKFSYTDIGKMFGVGANAIKKFARKLGIELKPMRGYWQKKAAGKL